MAFSEDIKLRVKIQSHYKCCICGSFEFLEIHHIVPQNDGGPDTEANAAPLCARCHDAYGDNPKKRKWIKEKRDFWFSHCERNLGNENLDLIAKMYDRIEKKIDENTKELRRMNGEEETRIKEKAYEFGYDSLSFFGSVDIAYGASAKTIARHKLRIKAEKEIDKFEYFSGSATAEFLPVRGFTSSKDSTYQKIHKFPSWDGTVGKGPFANLHRISLPIPITRKGQERELSFNVRQNIHYHELTGDADMTSHFYYFRIPTQTIGATFLYRIPNGKMSEIVLLVVSVEHHGIKKFEKELRNLKSHQAALSKYGSYWLRSSNRHTSLHWTIPQLLPQGYIFKLLWTTEKK